MKWHNYIPLRRAIRDLISYGDKQGAADLLKGNAKDLTTRQYTELEIIIKEEQSDVRR